MNFAIEKTRDIIICHARGDEMRRERNNTEYSAGIFRLMVSIKTIRKIPSNTIEYALKNRIDPNIDPSVGKSQSIVKNVRGITKKNPARVMNTHFFQSTDSR